MKTILNRKDAGLFVSNAVNDNFADSELPTSIPPGKALQSAELAALCAGMPVRQCGRVATLSSLERRRLAIVRKAREPVAFTASPAFTGTPANDDREPQSWPLAEALRRAGRESDIEVCEYYRGLWSIMAADPLQGRDPNMSGEGDEEVRVESRSSLDNGPSFPDAVSGTGELSYKGIRQTARTPGATAKAVRKGDGDSGDRYRSTAARFNENTLIAQIDMRETWHRLRSAIRPLLPAFEDACLDGMTMTEVGEARGYKDKQASAVGKVLVFTAIDTLSEEWGDIRREADQLEQQADRNVIRFRTRHERAVATYLGKAA